MAEQRWWFEIPPRARCRKSIYPLLDVEYILEARSAESSTFLSPSLNHEPVCLNFERGYSVRTYSIKCHVPTLFCSRVVLVNPLTPPQIR